MKRLYFLLAPILLAGSLNISAQAIISGRLLGPRFVGSQELIPFTAILGFESASDPMREPSSCRTWETEPTGWFRFNTDAGDHTLLFTGPNHFLRPILMNNIFLRPAEKVDNLRPEVRLDFANFYEKEWDPKPATAYFQMFVAKGKAVTGVGFRLATDGVDGGGPGAQTLVVSVHRRGPGTPDTWQQVGPESLVPDVDCGGAKNYIWCAGWNSGEVPLVPGETYAVQIRAQKPGGTFQAFWRPDADTISDCYRVGGGSGGFQGRKMWLGVSTDGDGVLIPYNKRIHKQYGKFAGFASRWTQTYVAHGRSLVGVVLYAAVGGAQPPLSRQRVLVRVRRGGPEGVVVGNPRLAIGNGNYTGDASWGTFGLAYAPGEVPLTPGETYAIEFESYETVQTVGGFVNIKGQKSDGRAGFNPYRKYEPDDYPQGKAYKNGLERMEFSLDMQVLEYESTGQGSAWKLATESTNLLVNGRMEDFDPAAAEGLQLPGPTRGASGYEPKGQAVGQLSRWANFSVEGRPKFCVMMDDPGNTNHYARVFLPPGEPGDGGYVQGVGGLHSSQTYRLKGRLRSSWAVDFEHQLLIGLDPTGQENDPKGATINWTAYPARHGEWIEFTSEPMRPSTGSISVWLRGRSTSKGDTYVPYRAEFDEVGLFKVRTSPPEQ